MRRILGLVMIIVAAMNVNAQEFSLWYSEPAQVWTDALPLGNGRLGAMVYGIPATERIQLNEENIWAGQPNANHNPEAKEWIPKIQQMIWEGKYAEAQEAATAHVMSSTNWGMPYQTFGEVYIAQQGIGAYTNYRRELSLDSAVCKVSFQSNGVTYRREVIASMTDDVMTIRLTADKPGSITFNANFTTPHEDVLVKTIDDRVALQGVASKHEGLKGKIRFTGLLDVRLKGGSKACHNGVMSVQGADEAIVYISIATNFVNYKDFSADENQRAAAYLDKAMANDYTASRKDHTDKFSMFMRRTSLTLGEDKYAAEPTDERVIRFAERDDNHLVATYFAFGKYLLTSCSQPGGQAANLQGIWNDKLFPSWDCKYTTNINLEMNYWPTEPLGMDDLNEPLFRLIDEVSQTGAVTAREQYGKDGWVLHHNTDVWRVTGGIDRSPSGMWMTGAAWLCQHLWQHYLYSGDMAFLRKIYPTMKGAAKFLDEMLVREPQTGYMVIAPAVSPENTHPGGNGKKYPLTAGTTMDNELLYDLFSEVAMASDILGEDKSLAEYYRGRIGQLAPLQIGSWGQLQEWLYDWDDPKDDHRHVSHLYGLYPSAQISVYNNPLAAQAAKTSLIHRGDPSTGWSMGWKVCLWARLHDGNHAYKLIHDQLTLTDDRFIAYGTNKKKGGTYRNLFDAHPPFQIDGNFGCTAGIAEMLVQSHDGCVELLPALPDAWKGEGSVTGLHTRGGFIIDEMKWKGGRITRLVIRSTIGGQLRLQLPHPVKGLKKAKGENSNPLFNVVIYNNVKNNSQEAIQPIQMSRNNIYDIQTTKGQSIDIKL